MAVALLTLFVCMCAAPSLAASRIKDLIDIEGVRENQLVGYGLIVGLNGTGDTLNNSPYNYITNNLLRSSRNPSEIFYCQAFFRNLF